MSEQLRKRMRKAAERWQGVAPQKSQTQGRRTGKGRNKPPAHLRANATQCKIVSTEDMVSLRCSLPLATKTYRLTHTTVIAADQYASWRAKKTIGKVRATMRRARARQARDDEHVEQHKKDGDAAEYLLGQLRLQLPGRRTRQKKIAGDSLKAAVSTSGER